uniref:CBS domain-containing protein CBSX5-like n=1 Tax=Erigeron canadensis TaxID=72917 RepID=UPI001CB96585|nr:CBS domain-containing protein CBSX5-like [Erigeron canadensis]
MAITFFATKISDLCLGKPPLRSLPATATIADAVFALKKSGDIYVSIWSCDRSAHDDDDKDYEVVTKCCCCRCVGKICMVDVIVFLCNDYKNLLNPSDALQSNVLDLLLANNVKAAQIRHLEPNSSLLEAIDCILEGAQNLVIPIYTNSTTCIRKNQLNKPSDTLHDSNQEFCWLTQEDVVRFFLNSIGVFSPIPTFTIDVLDIIDKSILTVHYDDPAISMLPLIKCSLMEQTSIGVINKDNHLIGEISPCTLACCDETAAAAIATLSAGDLMAYIDYTGPLDDLVNLVKIRLQERNLNAMLDLMDDYYNPLSSSSLCCSSDEEFGSSKNGCVGRFYPGRRSEAIICHPWNSLMAVMVQMIALRVSYAWVVQQDYTLVGIVTFVEILKQFRRMAGTRINKLIL